MSHRFAVVALALVCLAVAPASASAAFGPFTPGAPGIGDPYFPLDGNGGYDVDHYLLELRYTRPPTCCRASRRSRPRRRRTSPASTSTSTA